MQDIKGLFSYLSTKQLKASFLVLENKIQKTPSFVYKITHNLIYYCTWSEKERKFVSCKIVSCIPKDHILDKEVSDIVFKAYCLDSEFLANMGLQNYSIRVSYFPKDSLSGEMVESLQGPIFYTASGKHLCEINIVRIFNNDILKNMNSKNGHERALKHAEAVKNKFKKFLSK